MPEKTLALVWIDIETPGVPPDDDPLNYDTCYPLEVAVIVTDLDLDPLTGYQAVVKPTAASIATLKANDFVLNMHRESGLIDAMKDKEHTEPLAEVEANLVTMLKTRTTFDKREFTIAGSGVAAFDHQVLKRWMPTFNSWLNYFPFDIGVERRVSSILAGGDIYNPLHASFGKAKVHRAQADVEAHIEEARRQASALMEFREFQGLRDDFLTWRKERYS